MVEMRIDRPMGEDYIRFFHRQELGQGIGSLMGDFGGAVNLSGEDRFRAQDLASGLGLGGANGGCLVVRFARNASLASRQIDDGRLMAGGRIARQSTAAAGLRIVRMPAHTDDSQWTRDIDPAL